LLLLGSAEVAAASSNSECVVTTNEAGDLLGDGEEHAKAIASFALAIEACLKDASY
jgi:hypothetical protein